MKFRKLLLFLFFLLIIPNISAKGKYDDVVADIIGRETNSEKLTIYFFHGDGCPHCAEEEKFLKKVEKEYSNYVEIIRLEVWYNKENSSYLEKVKKHFNITINGVPFTVVGNNYYMGYSSAIKSQILNDIKSYIKYKNNPNMADFEDIVADIVGREINADKLTIYLFYGEGCPHCAKEKEFFSRLQKKYKNYIEIVQYEVWYNSANSSFLKQVKRKLMSTSEGVPFTVIGTKYFVGFNETVGNEIENTIKEYLQGNGIDVESLSRLKLPLLGYVDGKNVSLPLVAVVLGIIDGFNPCAMWVLLFLINMLFGMKNRKRMWLLGIVFLLTSGFVYFLAMLGISVTLSIASVWIRRLIGVVAIIGGILNLRTVIKSKNDGCHVVDEKKRKTMFKRIKKFTSEQSLILALVGVITLAVSVNMVELACSLGFPAIYSSLLSLNDVNLLQRIIYLLIYTLFYLIDDLVIFVAAMSTLKLTGISTKYNKYSSLIGGIIMFIIGLLLIFKPEWLMFNFS